MALARLVDTEEVEEALVEALPASVAEVTHYFPSDQKLSILIFLLTMGLPRNCPLFLFVLSFVLVFSLDIIFAIIHC